ncbi:hypothetical protein [Natronorubrum sp. DTA28]|uniref:hypothetical protein n=1 Tax=Natronorubrum sp. DTA28 TaxID=3447019 RepID=UPI003F8412DD
MDPPQMRRRSVLLAGASTIGLLSGCVAWPDGDGGPGEEVPPEPPEPPVTQPPGGDEGDPLIDDPPQNPDGPGVAGSDLAQYSNAQYQYTVLYPETWVVDEQDPAAVTFVPDTDIGFQIASVFESQSESLEELINRHIQAKRELAPDAEVLNQQQITLPSGQAAALVDWSATFEGLSVRARAVITNAGSIGYSNENIMLADAYTDEFDAIAERIAASLTIQG